MGWSYGRYRNMKALHEHILSPDRTEANKVIAHASKKFGRELYFVWERPTGERHIAVYMCNGDKKDGYWMFGYKDMSESMGPTIANCPPSFFDMVPDPGGHATAWRQQCRANAARAKATFETGNAVMVGGAADPGPYWVVCKRPRSASYVVVDRYQMRYRVATHRLTLYIAEKAEVPA